MWFESNPKAGAGTGTPPVLQQVLVPTGLGSLLLHSPPRRHTVEATPTDLTMKVIYQKDEKSPDFQDQKH